MDGGNQFYGRFFATVGRCAWERLFVAVVAA
jgi:hypothetical protein